MPHTLIEYFLLGFAIAAVPGVVFFETIRRTLSHHGGVVEFVAGNFVGSFIVIAAIQGGLAKFLTNQGFARALYISSGLLLVYLGVMSVRSHYNRTPASKMKKKEKSDLAAFIAGVVLDAANPIGIIFWITMAGRMVHDNSAAPAIVAGYASLMLGGLTVSVLLIVIVSHARKRIQPHHLELMAHVFGLIILTYGLITIGKVL
jgi:threonine/homoserine/homoserine lactone efflux protein